MSSEIYISTQKIFDKTKSLYAYDLTFSNSEDEFIDIEDEITKTSKIIMNSLTNSELNKLLGKKTRAFISVNENNLLKGVLDNLDERRFILNISNTIDLNEKVKNKIIQYKKRGFLISIEAFDSSNEMIKKFVNLFNFIDIIKVNTIHLNKSNLLKLVKKFKGTRIKFLAENIENHEDHQYYLSLDFEYFQGWLLDKPKKLKISEDKIPAQIIIINLIRLIKEGANSLRLEKEIKKHADLSFKLIEFFNRTEKLNTKIESITQVMSLLGSKKILKWLSLYLYSQINSNTPSSILDLAIRRAELMEEDASPENKDKAYLAGMLSMISNIFDGNPQELMKQINIDKEINDLIIYKKGIFAGSLIRAEQSEREYLKKIMIANFDKLNIDEILYTLEEGGVDIDKDKIKK